MSDSESSTAPLAETHPPAEEEAPPAAVEPLLRRGQRLEQARLQAGLTIADVASRLRLSQAQIEALEQDDLAALPPATFVRGFVRNYARLLKLPVEALEQAPTAGAAASATQPAFTLQPPPSVDALPLDGRASANRRWLGAAVVALVIGAVIGVVRLEHLDGARDLVADQVKGPVGFVLDLFRSKPVPSVAMPASTAPAATATPMTTSVAADPGTGAPGAADPGTGAPGTGAPALPAALAVADAASAAAPSASPPVPAETALANTPASTTVAASGEAGNVLDFSFEGDSWVEVRDSTNTVIYSRTSHAGDIQSVSFRGQISVVIGNARSTHLSLNGADVMLAPHTKVTVARLKLDAAGPRP